MKRFLTSKEIEDILSFITPESNIPEKLALSIVEINKEKLRKQLKGQELYPSVIPLLKKEIISQFYKSLIHPGESVGIICAQSIGEKQTQTTLNTFHKAGQSEKTMTTGVPRFQELLNATKKPKNINHKIYFTRNNNSIKDLREIVNNKIVGLTLPDVTISSKIFIDKEDETWYKWFEMLYTDKFREYKNCISYKFNIKKLYENKLKMEEIAKKIEDEYADLVCVFSPLSLGQMDIFVNTDSISLPTNRIYFINKDNAVEIYLEECVQPILEKMYICGVPSVTEIFYTHDNDEWFIETNSFDSKLIDKQYNSFKQILGSINIDSTRTISNNIWDIYEILGIEASRQFLIEEFINIMEGINECHAKLLVDRMTHMGRISSITRYTLNSIQDGDCDGPFGKASFEESLDNFLNASANGNTEPTIGVSASIVCGKRCGAGTGISKLKVDISKLM
jgi:DNA-directed RNA polymerase beta' subunit